MASRKKEPIAVNTNDSSASGEAQNGKSSATGAGTHGHSASPGQAKTSVRTSLLEAVAVHQAQRISDLERQLERTKAKYKRLSDSPPPFFHPPGLAVVPPVPSAGAPTASPTPPVSSAIRTTTGQPNNASAHRVNGTPQPHQPHAVPHNPAMAAAMAAVAASLPSQSTALHHPLPFLFPHPENPGMNPLMGVIPSAPPKSTQAPAKSSSAPTTPSPQPAQGAEDGDRKQSRYWTAEEHQRYLAAVSACGPKNYVRISEFVGTRNARQVRTHAQKYQKKLEREEARRRGDTRSGNDVASPSSDGAMPSTMTGGALNASANSAFADHPSVVCSQKGSASLQGGHAGNSSKAYEQKESGSRSARSTEGSSSTNNASSGRNFAGGQDEMHVPAAAAAAIAAEAVALGVGRLPPATVSGLQGGQTFHNVRDETKNHEPKRKEQGPLNDGATVQPSLQKGASEGSANTPNRKPASVPSHTSKGATGEKTSDKSNTPIRGTVTSVGESSSQATQRLNKKTSAPSDQNQKSRKETSAGPGTRSITNEESSHLAIESEKRTSPQKVSALKENPESVARTDAKSVATKCIKETSSHAQPPSTDVLESTNSAAKKISSNSVSQALTPTAGVLPAPGAGSPENRNRCLKRDRDTSASEENVKDSSAQDTLNGHPSESKRPKVDNEIRSHEAEPHSSHVSATSVPKSMKKISQRGPQTEKRKGRNGACPEIPEDNHAGHQGELKDDCLMKENQDKISFKSMEAGASTRGKHTAERHKEDNGSGEHNGSRNATISANDSGGGQSEPAQSLVSACLDRHEKDDKVGLLNSKGDESATMRPDLNQEGNVLSKVKSLATSLTSPKDICAKIDNQSTGKRENMDEGEDTSEMMKVSEGNSAENGITEIEQNATNVAKTAIIERASNRLPEHKAEDDKAHTESPEREAISKPNCGVIESNGATTAGAKKVEPPLNGTVMQDRAAETKECPESQENPLIPAGKKAVDENSELSRSIQHVECDAPDAKRNQGRLNGNSVDENKNATDNCGAGEKERE